MSALRSFVGVRRFAKYRKLYEHRLEQEKQKKEKNNVVSKKSVRNPFIGMSLRELAHNEKLMEYLETEEEQLYREEQQEKAERYQLICFFGRTHHTKYRDFGLSI